MTILPDDEEKLDGEKNIVTVDASDPNRGRFDPTRFGKFNPNDTEERPVITREDIETTRAELAELRRRMTRRTA